ncbi:MAG: ABC transporter substrate-binding protein [Anaerolineaceae bacterium]|nr:ABC transporter substrate-binding protein [Anaerolineaceae bacterium]
MLRGCRWQFTLFLLAALSLAAGLVWRDFLRSDPEQGDSDPPPATTAAIATPGTGPVDAPVIGEMDGEVDIPTFREGLVGSLAHLNPLLVAPGSLEAQVGGLIYEGLTGLNSQGEPVPELAAGLTVTTSGLEYVVTLRDDVLWQDGVPLTATDVKFTISLLQARDFPADSEVARFWRTVEVDVLAANVLRFRLSQPLGSFLDRLTLPILPWHALQGTAPARLADHPFNWSPIGTGRWQLEALRHKENEEPGQVDFRLAPTWQGRGEATNIPAGSRLRLELFGDFDEALHALAGGAIDGLAARTLQQQEAILALAGQNALHLAFSTDQRVAMLIFNWQREASAFLRDQRVRLAMASSLDREAVVTQTLGNRAVIANSPLWPGAWAWTNDLAWPGEDLDAARWLLQTARTREDGVESGGDNTLALRVLAFDDPVLEAMLQTFAGQWARVGIEVTIDSRPDLAYRQALRNGDFDAALVEYSAGHSTDPDIYPFWHVGQYPDGLNFGGVDDRRLSELLERARREPWGVNRSALYREVQETFAERVIALPLYHPVVIYATAPGVGGIQLDRTGIPANRFESLDLWPVRSG